MSGQGQRGGLAAYRDLLSDPRNRAFSLAGFVARMPLSMTGLGIVLLVSMTTGSFGRAGLIAAFTTVAAAIAGPAWGRTIDRVGQARVLVVAALINSAGLAALTASITLGAPLWVSCLAAIAVGLGFSSAGAAVRARWSYRLQDSPLLGTAFAFEAVVDESIFIVGPILVTLLATAVHPALGPVVCLVLGLTGALLLAALRDTQPPVKRVDHTRGAAQRRDPLPLRLMIAMSIAAGALGAYFGGMEVVVVAFARAAGIPQFTGLILTAWAFGSLMAGVVTGMVVWRMTPLRRFRIFALLLAASTVPLAFASAPVVVAAVLMLGGLAISPTMVACMAVIQHGVPGSRLTEALAWTTAGLATGVALGAATLGQVLDAYGPRAGFYGVIAIGLLLVGAVLGVRDRRPSAGPAIPPGQFTAEPDTPAAALPRPAE